MSVGFRFEPAANGIPSSVFFPQSDPEDRLTQCSASLQALLGLPSTSLQALAKLTTNGEAIDDVITVIQQVFSQLNNNKSTLDLVSNTASVNSQNLNTNTQNAANTNNENSSAEVTINVRLWSIPGFHELLASLGLDLVDVGEDKVTLRAGKQANKRNVQFVLQSLLALFGEYYLLFLNNLISIPL